LTTTDDALVTSPWTELGWASKGSQLQTQLYVNRHRDALNEAVLEALPSLAERRPELTWVAPVEDDGFAEPRDGMLSVLGKEGLRAELATFWPSRGPVWDALATCRFPDGSDGVVLAEGKSYPEEMYGGGTRAGTSGSEASLESRRKIERATAWAQGRLGVPLDVRRWLDPLDPDKTSSSLYQTANRLTFALWLRSKGVQAWLCHLLFLNDRLHNPTDRATWEAGLDEADRRLGIDGIDIPCAGHAFLEALDPAEEFPARAP
jgi:hypothetical protein